MKPSSWLMLALLLICVALAAISAVFKICSWLEAVSVVTGAACVWLTVKESIWNFPISLLNVSTFCVVFFEVGLYADAALQIVYFVLTVIGWYMWVFGGEKRTALKVSRTGTLESALVITSVAALTFGFYFTLQFLIDRFGGGVSNMSPSFWDALTTAVCLGAQWLLNRKKLENWILWIVADVIYVPLYLSKGLYLTSALYAVFLVMATMGLIQWIQKHRKLQSEKRPESLGFPVETAA